MRIGAYLAWSPGPVAWVRAGCRNVPQLVAWASAMQGRAGIARKGRALVQFRPSRQAHNVLFVQAQDCLSMEASFCATPVRQVRRSVVNRLL